ncbi:MAG TPA: hypothetical protein VFG79_15280 [Solirubrobacter sp.]|nr:hypothetical protein [Solirubrobacter sp.]
MNLTGRRRRPSLHERLDALERRLASLSGGLEKRLDKRVTGLRREVAELRKVADDIDRNVQAILRRQALDELGAPYPQRLLAQRWRGLSHQEEDGLTLAVLAEIGTPTRRAVEIGCGTNGGNSGVLASDFGFDCLMLDAAPWCTEATARLSPQTITAVTRAITAGNVNATLSEHGFTGEVDLVSIDVDSVDYWVWDALEAVAPRLVIAEYNSAFGARRALTLPERTDLDRDALPAALRGLWFGASLQAFARVAARKGYRLVAVTPPGVNAYWVRDDLAPQLPALDVERAWRSLHKLEETHREIDPQLRVEPLLAAFAERGYTVVDLDAAGSPAA